MKVLNLQCDLTHVFEGWFASEQDFASQLDRKLVQCPVCNSDQVHKLPSAPRLNLSKPKSHEPTQTQGATELQEADQLSQVQGQLLQAVRSLMANTEDVGERFAQEARSMHEGESPARNIRGQATPEQTRELLQEGVPILPLNLPQGLKNTLQ